MRDLTINGTDLRVSAVCMGTAMLGSTVSAADSVARLSRFADRGGTFLDTAHVYADWVPDVEPSVSEKTIGRWLRTRPDRDRIVVATKGGHRLMDSEVPTLHPEELSEQIECSRQNLNLDCLPLYYLHRDDPTLPVDLIMDTLFEQQDLGRIRYLACSNWRQGRVIRANEYAARCGRTGFVAVSNRWSLARCREGAQDPTLADMNDDFYDFHCRTGMATIPFSSTAGGYLSKLLAGKSISDSQRECYDLPENPARAARAAKLAADHGLTVAQIALCYFYAQPFPAIPVTAFSNDAQMDEALESVSVRLTEEEYRYLTGGQKW